ncbi:hypothetical protein CWI38_0987p0010, partial [Hamiltosporidium tvaerminnensis]
KLHSKLYNARKNELVSVSDSSRWCKRGNIRPRNEDRNLLWGSDGMCQHCNKFGKTVDHLATRCEKMLGHDYTRRHNEVSSKRIRSHSVQEILDNEYAVIRITLIEVGITSQDSLQIVETEKLRKYDLLANELGLIYKLEIQMKVEAYIQSLVLKNTAETISFDRRRGLESGLNAEESWERASMGSAKNFKPKNKAPFISQGGTTLEEPTNNINEESDSEEETIVVKEVEENM